MNRILLALSDLLVGPEPRFNLCVKGVGFLAQPPLAPRFKPSRFVSITLGMRAVK